MRVLGITRQDGSKSFCDKRCHTSTGKKCFCICNGLMHGKGEAYAKLVAPRASAYVYRTPDIVGPVWLNPELVPSQVI